MRPGLADDLMPGKLLRARGGELCIDQLTAGIEQGDEVLRFIEPDHAELRIAIGGG